MPRRQQLLPERPEACLIGVLLEAADDVVSDAGHDADRDVELHATARDPGEARPLGGAELQGAQQMPGLGRPARGTSLINWEELGRSSSE